MLQSGQCGVQIPLEARPFSLLQNIQRGNSFPGVKQGRCEKLTTHLGGTALRFLGPKPALGVSWRDLQKRLGRWLVNQHEAQWRGLGDTQRQAHEFISGPSLGTRAKFMNFHRIQSRVVTGLLTGRNTLWKHLYLLGLLDSPLCRTCGVGEETSAHILCECEA
jgi:hypothetical protein